MATAAAARVRFLASCFVSL